MATNDAQFSVTGYVATQPKKGLTKSGTKTLTFRIGWTPREVSRQTGEWADLPSSFVSVTCYRKIAENAAYCLRKGDPIVLNGTLRVREYEDQAGSRRNSVDVVADFLGHDLARGTSNFNKQAQRAQQTAEEYELSLVAGGNRLPGDVEAVLQLVGQQAEAQQAEALGGQQPEVTGHDEYGLAGGADALPEDLDEPAPVTLAEPDGDDIEDADGDDIEDADGDDLDEPGEVSEPEATKSRGRIRKAAPVGASV